LFRNFVGFSPVLVSEESQKHVFSLQNVDFRRKREIFTRPTGMLGQACDPQKIYPCPKISHVQPKSGKKLKKLPKEFVFDKKV